VVLGHQVVGILIYFDEIHVCMFLFDDPQKLLDLDFSQFCWNGVDLVSQNLFKGFFNFRVGLDDSIVLFLHEFGQLLEVGIGNEFVK